jgi:5-(hydroxymethyl)furfural/furfural oxidase
MLMMPANRTGWHPLGRRVGSLGVCVNKSFSRGIVRLAARDCRIEPYVDLNMLSDERDLKRLTKAFKLMYRIIESPVVKAYTDGWFLAGYNDEVRALHVRTVGNWIRTASAAALVDAGSLARRWLYKLCFGDAAQLHAMVGDEQAIEDWVKSSVWSGWHVCGTCKMGREDDPLAVVDRRGRVRGTGGLRIADASIMPTIVRANTNITTIAIAEKVSDIVLQEALNKRMQHA